jgi:hypothetical protein
MLLIAAGGQFVRFVVNAICEDFVWFILIFYLSNHSCRRSRRLQKRNQMLVVTELFMKFLVLCCLKVRRCVNRSPL